MKEDLILNLVEDVDKILYTFEKDGKFAMSSSIRNELFQEATKSLKQVKDALAQPEQEPVAYCYVQQGTSVDILTFDDAPNDAVDGQSPPSCYRTATKN